MSANEADERLAAALGHAALALTVMPDGKADSIRRFLRDEVASDPSLAGDADRVGRLVERVSKAIDSNGANRVQAATELRNIRP
jgi:hypothetical protein